MTSTSTLGAGALTRVAELSGEPSPLVRNADASCAFAPRRVASSETAREAVRRSAAETAMSRVVYSDNTATADQELLRTAHQVRLVSAEEEGTSLSGLPGGVYGFSYSPGLPGAPLFAIRSHTA